MKKFLTSVFMLSMVLFSMSVFDSCKDYDEDEYNDLLIQINKNDANLELTMLHFLPSEIRLLLFSRDVVQTVVSEWIVFTTQSMLRLTKQKLLN